MTRNLPWRRVVRWYKSTSNRTFVVYPIAVIAFELGLHRGALVVRLTRFTVHVPANLNGRAPLGPGSAVGLRAAAPKVRVFARTDAR